MPPPGNCPGSTRACLREINSAGKTDAVLPQGKIHRIQFGESVAVVIPEGLVPVQELVSPFELFKPVHESSASLSVASLKSIAW